jgi:hypothetical protein
MKNITVIKNFLEEKKFNLIKLALLEHNFPWYYNDGIIFNNKEGYENKNNFQFTHIFFINHSINSSMFNLIKPLIDKINPISLVRIKANLITKTNTIIEHEYHVDYDTEENMKTAIFYINSNNGYTKFKNGKKIKSEENKLVFFNSKLMHAGSTCTDEKVRVVINLNYF